MRLAVMIQAILAPWGKGPTEVPPPFYPYRDAAEPELAPDATAAEQLEWFRSQTKDVCQQTQ